MSQAQSNAKAFNLIMEGVGYLNRVRLVPVKKAEPYLACTINAMTGSDGDVEYTTIDCRVVGEKAIEAINLLKPSVDAKQKVIVGFRASDPRPDCYEYEHKGEMRKAEGLKARLLQLTFAKVDGQLVTIPLVERPEAPTPRGEGADKPAQSESREPAESEAA